MLGCSEDPEALKAIGATGLRRVGMSEAELDGAIARRAAARKAKDFAEADRVRTELLERGIELMDTSAGTEWRVVRG